ncbi:MAG: hypothetical protein A3G33_03330 [Omnitrophica bacterium RIFCSPLOWO2_12_FULL_44_17]|uniref:NAD(P)-binding domain-containing protein n=1 Tax=Candidatus Danuiimicrobium aquiferis TaxID=1801832 RepID=A0A1G1KTW5_9BACT|nr:MAG: hypothetical protein A3B72_06875 [Omnitrophica bacterium RIFCSPHIGHO2_02_FULL_45_28]OGW90192.1 MAG: hypothetical protein A3E74_06445 [Omnitrophica bacterium RIFCSPHIGHO2_12_FULL_44_12]OGW96350.1 MAG: hypothetical protein A3G33_03330 [Omnitrophica bacterium RIFCSPLOWO2_12_FULL_44_17]OGX04841.1 MAG: hypothetical protein A3J12_07800 [Omnitrophica bacterium RIFCSPLOWO2_02_FULL_44_11]
MAKCKKHLLIGSTGFLGSEIAKDLCSRNQVVFGTYHRHHKKGFSLSGSVRMFQLDVRNRQGMERLVARIKPDYIYYLAAQSSVRLSWANPVETININLVGGINLLEIAKKLALRSKIIIFSSGTIYGETHNHKQKVFESDRLEPKDPYSISKAALDSFARIYAKNFKLNICVVRPCNIVGRNQSKTFSIANFAYQIKNISLGKQKPIIDVGNLSASRDYIDVRDAIQAISEVSGKGKPGEAYNIGRGKPVKIGHALKEIIELSKIEKIKVRKNEAFTSKDEILRMALASGKMKQLSGWEPRIPLRQTLNDMLR